MVPKPPQPIKYSALNLKFKSILLNFKKLSEKDFAHIERLSLNAHFKVLVVPRAAQFEKLNQSKIQL